MRCLNCLWYTFGENYCGWKCRFAHKQEAQPNYPGPAPYRMQIAFIKRGNPRGHTH